MYLSELVLSPSKKKKEKEKSSIPLKSICISSRVAFIEKLQYQIQGFWLLWSKFYLWEEEKVMVTGSQIWWIQWSRHDSLVVGQKYDSAMHWGVCLARASGCCQYSTQVQVFMHHASNCSLHCKHSIWFLNFEQTALTHIWHIDNILNTFTLFCLWYVSVGGLHHSKFHGIVFRECGNFQHRCTTQCGMTILE